MYKRYYSPFEEDVIIEDDAEIVTPLKLEQEQETKENRQVNSTKNSEHCAESANLFGALGNDDIILIGILLLLLNEQKDNRDVPLILGIGFLLLINYIT